MINVENLRDYTEITIGAADEVIDIQLYDGIYLMVESSSGQRFFDLTKTRVIFDKPNVEYYEEARDL